jgi:hypothetical protein
MYMPDLGAGIEGLGHESMIAHVPVRKQAALRQSSSRR